MAVAQALTRVAKQRGLPILLVGQVTKDSTVAGPRALEHIVDTTLSLDGDKHSSLRLLRTVKNRFGPLEVAAFEQTDDGLREVARPEQRCSASTARTPVPGTCATVTVEGARAIAAEVQSLVGTRDVPSPRRAVSGLDSGPRRHAHRGDRAGHPRVALEPRRLPRHRGRYAGLRPGHRPRRVPGRRLGHAQANRSSRSNLAASARSRCPATSGPAPMMPDRAAEAVRLGYQRLLVPVGVRSRLGARSAGARIVEVGTLEEALLALQAPPVPRRGARTAATSRCVRCRTTRPRHRWAASRRHRVHDDEKVEIAGTCAPDVLTLVRTHFDPGSRWPRPNATTPCVPSSRPSRRARRCATGSSASCAATPAR